MKKLLRIYMILALAVSLAACKTNEALPLPELEEGMRGQLGIDKNINEKTIDKYLGRDDSVYYDMRMLKDEANYEAIGGDSYLSGYVKGFEVVPYPYLCNVTGLPEEVGQSYQGTTLFTQNEDGEYIANYAESEHIIESLIPKDKYIFLRCGGGGYAGMTKNLLVGLGYDADRIYDVGGYWYYEGNNKVSTTYEDESGIHYDFSSVPYHDIVFDALTLLREQEQDKDNNSEAVVIDERFIEISSTEELKQLEAEGKTFALYVYLPACASCASFLPVVKEFIDENNIVMYAVKLSDIYHEDNSVSERVSYTPSMFIYENGEVKAYLDPSSDSDLPYYQTLEGLSEWFAKYLDVKVISSDTYNEISDCESACAIGD